MTLFLEDDEVRAELLRRGQVHRLDEIKSFGRPPKAIAFADAGETLLLTYDAGHLDPLDNGYTLRIIPIADLNEARPLIEKHLREDLGLDTKTKRIEQDRWGN